VNSRGRLAERADGVLVSVRVVLEQFAGVFFWRVTRDAGVRLTLP
jgi:hypothetical protein